MSATEILILYVIGVLVMAKIFMIYERKQTIYDNKQSDFGLGLSVGVFWPWILMYCIGAFVFPFVYKCICSLIMEKK